MRLVSIFALAALVLQAGSRAADVPTKSDRTRVVETIDNGFKGLFPDYPVEMLGVPHMIYIKGYGAVLSGELNLAPGGGITPFHQTITRQDVDRTHQKKAERMTALRNEMQQLLVSSAETLKDVPDNEEVVLGISLFYWHWEERAGLPDQVVMHATKKALLAAGKDKNALAAALRVQEF
jgi:hypothetical protein